MNVVREARLINENRNMREALKRIHDLAEVENYSLSDSWFNALNKAFILAEMEPIEREILDVVGL